MKHGPDTLLEILQGIFNKCLIESQNIPAEWNVAHISFIYKMGGRRVYGNYKGISVTSSLGLKKRIEAKYIEIEEQGGFRAGRSCMGNIFTFLQVIEKRTSRNLSTHLVFIDHEAYDTVP